MNRAGAGIFFVFLAAMADAPLELHLPQPVLRMDEAEAEGLSADKILDQVLVRTPVPAKV